jgi:uncharacterized protein YlaI
MLHDTSSLRIEHHNKIKQLTGKNEVQLKGEGCLTSITRALENKERKELRQNKINAHHESRYIARKHLEQKCVLCGSTEELEVDHIDKNPFNNDPSNLRYLCFPCHHSSHSIFGRRNEYRHCFSCKKMRLSEKYNRVSLCSSCSLKLAYRWKEETNTDTNVYEFRENAEFKKWIESRYSFQ